MRNYQLLQYYLSENFELLAKICGFKVQNHIKQGSP